MTIRSLFDEMISKAQAGEEAGSFRGGDPEEIRIKREEKMQELEDSGALEDQGEAEEEPTQDEIEEAKAEDEAKKEDQGKSLVSKAVQVLSASIMPSQQVSPVDTFGDYQPRDANGDLLSQKHGGTDEDRARSQDYVAPAPPRAGANQHKNWSEVLGFRVPLSGEPLQHLRRYFKQGKDKEMSKEADLLVRSLEGETGILWCWRPDFYGGEISKGLESAPKPGHKYIKRWFEGGQWQYEYADDMHPEGKHGVHHSGSLGGHTIDIHPTTDHGKMTPEQAFHHSRHMHVAEGGSYPVKIFDKKSNRVVDRVVHMPGAKKDKEGKHVVDPKTGLPDIGFRGAIQLRMPGSTSRRGTGNKSFTDIDAFDRAMTRGHVTTEYDAHGDPWVHWRHPGKGTGRPYVMHDPKSRLNDNHPKRGEWGLANVGSVDGLRSWIANQKALQRAMKAEDERGHVSPEERQSAKDWEPTHHHVFDLRTMQKQVDPETGQPLKREMKTTNALERGDLGVWKWKDAPTVDTVRGEYKDRHVVRQGTELQFDSIHDRNKVGQEVLTENYGPLLAQARQVLKTANLIDNSNPEMTQGRIQELIHHGFMAAFDRAANTYNPNHSSGARFSTYLVTQAKNEMQNYLPNLLGERERQRAVALRRHSRISKDEAKLQEMVASGQATGKHHSRLQEIQHEKQMLEQAHGIVPRGEKIGEEQRLRAPAGQEREITARPSGRTSRGASHEMQVEGGAGYGVGSGFQPSAHSQLEAKQDLQQTPMEQWSQDQWDMYLASEGMGVDKGMVFQDLLSAVSIISKAEGDPEAPGAPAMKYLWREGEPGAHKYMWEDPRGNVVRGTNAPQDHPHHDPAAGPSQIHPHEPHPDRDEHMFDHFGRKLHRPAPEGVEPEHNENYDPDINHWSQKYQDPETGGEEFISLHSDRVKNHRYSHNEDLRHVDAQLEKVRQWYDQMFQAEDLRTKAIGLALALVDQAKMLADGEGSGLLSMRVRDIKLTGNGFQFTYKDSMGDKHTVMAVLDSPSSAVLHALAQGKKPGDLVFDVEGQPISQQELAQTLDEQFGLSLKQFRVYHGTELFSKVFQQIVSTHGDLKPEDLNTIADQACARVMRMLGHKKVDPSVAKQLYIDPIAIEALFMSAIHHHDEEINKSVAELLKAYKLHGRCVFQGLPVSIENRKGSTRSWYDPHEKKAGTTKMKHAYGYIRGTKGTDGDHVDVYIGPDKNADTVFVVHQRKAPDFKEFDEDKCMLGFSSGKEAKDAYMAQYDKPGFFGGMTAMPMEEFKEKVLSTKKRPQMIKAGDVKTCSVCKNSWGECDHSQEIEKSFAGSADTGPVVWHVSVTHPERTPDEKVFGDWIHSHPMHEHDQHWAAFKQATNVEDPPEPIHGREYATGDHAPDEEAGDLDSDEEDYSDVSPGRVEDVGDTDDQGGDEDMPKPPEPPPREVAKSLLDEMIRLAG